MAYGVKRVIVLVMDSAGCGEMPDAAAYGDQGANTLGHIAAKVGGLDLPALASLGLGKLVDLRVPALAEAPLKGCYGKMHERSSGKDTTTGHWEMMGLVVPKAFPTYPKGFPKDLLSEYERRIGRGTLGNKPASGTEIIKELGEEHVKTGKPIVYTSADSVFQIACHEDVIPNEELYRLCQVARDMLTGEHAVGRVIARPFEGRPGAFKRTPRRRDFSLKPHGPTVMDALKAAGRMVYAVGKIEDIFAAVGVTEAVHSQGNEEVMRDTLAAVKSKKDKGLIFANLVDFDMLFGHRNDPAGYAGALRAFDAWLPSLFAAMGPDDVMMITADHGNETTDVSTDHTREYVPILAWGPRTKPKDLGVRKSFADLGATVAELLDVKGPAAPSDKPGRPLAAAPPRRPGAP
jgi:phosphopentomutase